MPSTSLSAITATTPTSRRNANSSCSAATVAAIPCGLCAASSRIVGAVRTRSSRPGELTPREAVPDRVDVELPLGAGAEERLDRGQRQRGVLRLVRAVQRQEDLVVHAAEPLQRQHLPADRDARSSTPNSTLARDRGADLGAALAASARPPRRSAGRRSAWRRLDDAGLLGGDVLDRVAEEFGVVQPDRRDTTATGRGDVGGVPCAARGRLRPPRRRPARRRTPRTPAP